PKAKPPVPPSPAKATSAQKAPQLQPVTPTSSRVAMSKADVFGAGEEEAPISIEPEFMRPPSPAPARAMQRAKALSPGTLGLKKPAPPPRPPEKKAAPQPEPAPEKKAVPQTEPTPNPGTPSLGTLAAPVGAETK